MSYPLSERDKQRLWKWLHGLVAIPFGFIITGILTTLGGRIVNADRYTSNQTLDNTNHVIFGDTDGGAFSITFIAGVDGTHHRISNVGSSNNALTLIPDGSELLVGDNENFDLLDGETLDLCFESTEGWVA